MNILEILYKLQAAFHSNRQAGHTKFARSIASVGGIVICANEQQAQQVGRLFGQKYPEGDDVPITVSMQNLGLVEARGVPLVLDNFAVMKICELGIFRIQQQHEDYKILTEHHRKSELAWARELQGVGKMLNDSQRECDRLADIIQAGRRQLKDAVREIVTLKIALSLRKITHIRVTRPTKKRRR